MAANTLTRDILDELVYPDMGETLYLGYRLIWRGWFASPKNERLVGKWLGYPQTADLARPLPYLVSLAGGRACGSFLKMEYWDTRPTEGTSPILMDHAVTDEGRRHMANVRRHAKTELRRLVRAVHRGGTVPHVGFPQPIAGSD